MQFGAQIHNGAEARIFREHERNDVNQRVQVRKKRASLITGALPGFATSATLGLRRGDFLTGNDDFLPLK